MRAICHFIAKASAGATAIVLYQIACIRLNHGFHEQATIIAAAVFGITYAIFATASEWALPRRPLIASLFGGLLSYLTVVVLLMVLVTGFDGLQNNVVREGIWSVAAAIISVPLTLGFVGYGARWLLLQIVRPKAKST